MKLKPILCGATLAFLLASGGTLRAQSHVPGPTDYDQFSAFIAARNIFDPARQPHTGGYRPPRVNTSHRKHAPAFSFVGAMSYKKGMFAFFDGNSPEYRKALEPSGTIGGFTVREISLGGVELVSEDATNFLKVGFQMRKGNDGVWEQVASTEGFSDHTGDSTPAETTDASSSSAAASSPSPNLPASDVLKRLMQRRQQESK